MWKDSTNVFNLVSNYEGIRKHSLLLLMLIMMIMMMIKKKIGSCKNIDQQKCV